MMATAFLLLLLLLLSSAIVGYLGDDTDTRAKSDPQCQGKGQQCSSDFSSIIYCNGKNGTSYIVHNCSAQNKMCSATDENGFKCSKKSSDPPVQQHKMIPFVCHGKTIFPDPYFCNIAYACSSDGEYPDEICECSNGMALVLYPFMHCTSNADMLEECSCPYKDRCDGKFNPGDFGNICQPGYFYTCGQNSKLGIVPNVYKCPDGQVFVDGRCSDGAELVKASEAAMKIQPSCKKYQPPCLPDDSIKCTTAGQLVAHKVERCYYSCDSNLKPILRDCGIGSYFTCKYGPCGCTYKPNN